MSDSIYYKLSLYTQPPLIVLGTVGAILNLILFSSRKALRGTSCSLYFQALSISDLFVLYIYVLLQWLVDQFGFDPTKQYTWYCKMKTFIHTGLYTLSPYFVVLACFDRLCTSSSSVRLRQVASIRVARCLIPCMAIIVFAAYSYLPFWYTIISLPTGPVCMAIYSQYNIIVAIIILALLGFLPPFLMTVFCSATLVFLRRQRRRVMPINQARLRQRDNQLLKMLLFYVTFHLICTIPFSTVLLIAVYRISTPSPTINLLFRIFVLLFNTNFSTSFYIYTLGTPFYRRELWSLVKDWKRRAQRFLHGYHSEAALRGVRNPQMKRS